MVGSKIDQYQIQSEIGRGGMGVVYKAQDTSLDRTVAIKFLPPFLNEDEEAKARFVHEAKSVSALDHPNIAVVHEIGTSDSGQLYMVMAFYDGETLEQVIERGLVSIDDALDVTRQIAAGLQSAHRKGIIHRDIKPGNVIITEDGLVKILDFGLAKVQDVTMTMGAMSLGTLAYMSPEQARGGDIDHRTDLWAVGVVLYEMLTGQRPFKGGYDAAILYSAANEPHEDPGTLRADIPDNVRAIINKLLKKSPDDRYPSAEDLITDLDGGVASSAKASGTMAGEGVGEGGFSLPAFVKKRSFVLSATGGAVAAAALIAWLAVGVGGDGSARPAEVSAENRTLAREHLQTGIGHLESRSYSLALAEIERSLELDSTYAPAWSSLSAAYLQLRDFDAAIVSGQKAIRMDSTNDGAYYNLGLALYEKGRAEEAFGALERATKINPQFTRAFSAWGDLLIENGRPDEALTVLERGRAAPEPQFKFLIYKNMGKAYAALGQYDMAVEYLEPALSLQPNWPETIALLAHTYDELGRRDQARELWEKYLQIETDPAKRKVARDRLADR